MSRHDVTVRSQWVEIDLVMRRDTNDGAGMSSGRVVLRWRTSPGGRWSRPETVCQWERVSSGRGSAIWRLDGEPLMVPGRIADGAQAARELVLRAWRDRALRWFNEGRDLSGWRIPDARRIPRVGLPVGL